MGCFSIIRREPTWEQHVCLGGQNKFHHPQMYIISGYVHSDKGHSVVWLLIAGSLS
jgi:hypothetical protein